MLSNERSEMWYKKRNVPEIASSKELKKYRTDNQTPPFEIVERETWENDKQALHIEQAKERLEKNVLGENEPLRKRNLDESMA